MSVEKEGEEFNALQRKNYLKNKSLVPVRMLGWEWAGGEA